MLTMLTSLDRYAPRTGTRFVAWVTTISMNTARRRFRRRRPLAPSTLVSYFANFQTTLLTLGARWMVRSSARHC